MTIYKWVSHDYSLPSPPPSRLFRVLPSTNESPATQKIVYSFLNHLQSSCTYIQKTYRSTFARYHQLQALFQDSYPPVASETNWHRTPITTLLQKPRWGEGVCVRGGGVCVCVGGGGWRVCVCVCCVYVTLSFPRIQRMQYLSPVLCHQECLHSQDHLRLCHGPLLQCLSAHIKLVGPSLLPVVSPHPLTPSLPPSPLPPSLLQPDAV